MNENLACLVNGHQPTGLLQAVFGDNGEVRNTCLYCHKCIYYLGDILSEVEGTWELFETIEKSS